MDLEWFSAGAIMATLLGKRYAFDAGRLGALALQRRPARRLLRTRPAQPPRLTCRRGVINPVDRNLCSLPEMVQP